MRIESFLRESRIYKLHREYRRLETELNPKLKELKLNLHQALVLLSIYFESEESVRPGHLSELFLLPKSQISHILSHLEAMQYIRRHVDPTDARSYHLRVRTEQKRRVQQLINVFERAEQKK